MLAIVGVIGVTASELLRTSAAQSTLADLAVACLIGAALLALFTRTRRSSHADRPSAERIRSGIRRRQLVAPAVTDPDEPEPMRTGTGRRSWWWAHVVSVLAVGALVQSWFVSGTVIAGGDITPPVGTAWINRLFSAMAWTGSNLGSINEAQQRLPWAVVVWLTHALGGSGAVAQRIWLTVLFMGIALAATALARALNFAPIAGVAAGLLYAFNPYLMSIGGVADAYLLSMALLAGLPALVVAGAKGSVPRWLAAIGLGLAGPPVGYAYANPPLVGMLVLALVFSVPLAWARYGRATAVRGVPVLLCGGLLMVAASTYWAVPAFLALRETAVATLSPLSAWTWTEGRATLANALWLNTAWFWKYPIYLPFAANFDRFPLLLVRVLVPAVALTALALPPTRLTPRRLRVTGAIALGTLAIILLSTGTNPPGNLIFDILYHLPLGWLLREPGRFLMVASLGFALMAGILVDGIGHVTPPWVGSTRAPRPSRAFHRPKMWSVLAFGGVVLTAAGSYPLWTGSVVPGRRPPFPASHVAVPRYWTLMAKWLNAPQSTPGPLLVLPPDDFYAMPYTWYYGNDGFITDLLIRHVIDPNSESYDLVSNELLSATRLEAQAIESRNWTEGARLLSAMTSPLILVRGDVVANFPGRSILSPGRLYRDLLQDPLMRLVHRDGPLSVFALTGGVVAPTGFATVNSAAPDLRALSLLPPGTALATSPPVAGHTAIYQLPSVATWQIRANSLVTELGERSGWTYRSVILAPGTSAQSPNAHMLDTQNRMTSSGRRLIVSVPLGPLEIRDGTFHQGLWGPVGNCDDYEQVLPGRTLRAKVLDKGGPAGAPFLQLSASADAACESQVLAWHRGSLLVKMNVRSRSGAGPSLCFWEQPENLCAPAAPLPAGRTWKTYTSVIQPSAGTKALTLFLYAFAPTPGQTSQYDYASLIVRSLPEAPAVDVIAAPNSFASPSTLDSLESGFGPGWLGPTGARHVELDGLTNGWIWPKSVRGATKASYSPIRDEIQAEVGAAALAALLAALLGLYARGCRPWRMPRKCAFAKKSAGDA